MLFLRSLLLLSAPVPAAWAFSAEPNGPTLTITDALRHTVGDKGHGVIGFLGPGGGSPLAETSKANYENTKNGVTPPDKNRRMQALQHLRETIFGDRSGHQIEIFFGADKESERTAVTVCIPNPDYQLPVGEATEQGRHFDDGRFLLNQKFFNPKANGFDRLDFISLTEKFPSWMTDAKETLDDFKGFQGQLEHQVSLTGEARVSASLFDPWNDAPVDGIVGLGEMPSRLLRLLDKSFLSRGGGRNSALKILSVHFSKPGPTQWKVEVTWKMGVSGKINSERRSDWVVSPEGILAFLEKFLA